MKWNFRKSRIERKTIGSDVVDNINEMMLKLIDTSERDKDIIKRYLEHNNIDDLFANYEGLGLSKDTMEQIESLIVIIENYEDM